MKKLEFNKKTNKYCINCVHGKLLEAKKADLLEIVRQCMEAIHTETGYGNSEFQNVLTESDNKYTTEKAIINNINGVATALIILLIIGALSGAWMISGVVPTLIYYGIQIIHPSFFLVSTCLICCIVSVMTGSSWTTIATIGIALMGIGEAQGFEPGWIAGAIISGAYFGDKMSPLSDTTVLASSTVGVRLFTHIRYLVYTTIPALCTATTMDS